MSQKWLHKLILAILIANLKNGSTHSSHVMIFENKGIFTPVTVSTVTSKSNKLQLKLLAEVSALSNFVDGTNLTYVFENLTYHGGLSVVAFPTNMVDFTTLVKHILILEQSKSHHNPALHRLKFYIFHPKPTLFLAMNPNIRLKAFSHMDGYGNFESDIYFILNLQHGSSIFEIYSLRNESKINLIISFIDTTNFETIVETKWTRRMNLKRSVISTVVSPASTNIIETKVSYDEHGEPFLVSGLSVDAFHYLRDALNFKVKIVEERNWPKLFPNGSWGGLGKALFDKTADIAINGITHNIVRGEVFSFLHALTIEPLQAFFTQPPTSSIRNVFIEPFKIDFWIWLGIFQIVVLFACVLVTYLQLKLSFKNQDFTLSINLWKVLRDCACDYGFWILSSICQQGHEVKVFSKPSSFFTPIKFICVSAMLTGAIVYGEYTAAIYSSLSVSIIPIKSLEDLLNSHIELVGDSTSQTVLSMFNVSTVKEFKAPEEVTVADYFENSKAFITYPISFFQTNQNTIKLSDRTICEHIFMIPISTPWPSAMMTRKDFPFKKLFSIKTVGLFQYGLMKRYRNNFFRSMKPTCMKRRSNPIKELEIIDLFTAFGIMLCGLLLSCFTIIVECFVSKWLKL